MKNLHKQIVSFLLLCSIFSISLYAQKTEKAELLVNLGYYTANNMMQYVQVKTQMKANNKLQPVQDIGVQLFLDSLSKENLVARLKTNEKGIAKAGIPLNLKENWTANAVHKFIAVTEASKNIEETTTEIEVNRAKIVLDTVNTDGVRTVSVQVLSFESGEWVPAADVELKIGVSRLGGQIKIGEEESYTTDSTGQISAEFKVDSLPATDKKGNITLVAKIEDNDKFGNLMMEKTVPWGKYYHRENNFGERSLFATRFRTPIWLLFMAYSIIASVWGVIIYLIFVIVKIKKQGKKHPESTDKSLQPSKALAIE
ncbi:MAG: hypothetical protein ACJ749_01955 [Flavisolibacter sp.]